MDKTLVELLGLPDVDHAVYRSSPLVLALCQVRFNRVLGVASPATVAPFQQAVQDRYPVLGSGDVVQLQIGIGQSGAQLQHAQSPDRWQFADLEDNWKLVLASDFLSLETRTYESFSDFLERLQHALNALAQCIRPSFVTRVGLRYINELRSTDPVWSDALRPELLGPLAVPYFQDNVAQAVQQVTLRYEGGFGINLHHGLLPAGTTVQPRPGTQTETGQFYLLDLDAYREFPKPGGTPLDVESICCQVRDFNRANYRLFRWAVSESFVSPLGVLRYADD